MLVFKRSSLSRMKLYYFHSIGNSTHCYHHPSMLLTFKKMQKSVQLQPNHLHHKVSQLDSPLHLFKHKTMVFVRNNSATLDPFTDGFTKVYPSCPEVVSTHFDPRRQRRDRFFANGAQFSIHILCMYYVYNSIYIYILYTYDYI